MRSTSKPRLTTVIPIALALALTGCGGDKQPAAGTGSAVIETESLEEVLARAGQVEWRLISMGDDVLIPGEINATIRFTGDEFRGQAPCNRYFGARSTDPASEGPFAAVGATRMMCPERQMLYEEQYFEALNNVRQVRFEDERLIFDWQSGDDAGELVFVRVLTPME